MKDRPVVYIGVDVAKDSLSVDAGEVFKGEIENSTDAIRGLLNKLTKRCVDDQVVCICFESTGPYGERLFLECCEAGVPACILNPAKVRHYAKAMSEAAKTDPIDARVIRLFAENKRPEPTPPPSAATIHLRKLVLTRNALMKSVVQLSGTQETVVGSAAGEVLAKAIAELRMRIKELDRLITHAIAGDQRIAGLAAALAEIDGVGKLSAAKMVAMVPELGTLGRRRSAALAGLAPFTRDSGRYKRRIRVTSRHSTNRLDIA